MANNQNRHVAKTIRYSCANTMTNEYHAKQNATLE